MKQRPGLFRKRGEIFFDGGIPRVVFIVTTGNAEACWPGRLAAGKHLRSPAAEPDGPRSAGATAAELI